MNTSKANLVCAKCGATGLESRPTPDTAHKPSPTYKNYNPIDGSWHGFADSNPLSAQCLATRQGATPAPLPTPAEPGPAATPTAPATPIVAGSIEALIADRITPDLLAKTQQFLDDNQLAQWEKLKDAFKSELADTKHTITTKITKVIISSPGTTDVVCEQEHEIFPQVAKLVSLDIPVFLQGEAGCGKSQLARNIARSLGLPFRGVLALCDSSMATDMIGYVSASGSFQATPFMQAFEYGGVGLMDELDAANPNVLTVLNDTISSRSLYHPHKDAVITAHADFRVIAAANTFGTGATARYAGRNQLDSASINRFAQIAMSYDENLERSIVQQKINASSASESLKQAALAWCLRVQAYRKAVNQQDLDIIVGSRAIYTGIKIILSDAGFKVKQLEQMLIFAGVDSDTFKTVKAVAEVE